MYACKKINLYTSLEFNSYKGWGTVTTRQGTLLYNFFFFCSFSARRYIIIPGVIGGIESEALGCRFAVLMLTYAHLPFFEKKNIPRSFS